MKLVDDCGRTVTSESPASRARRQHPQPHHPMSLDIRGGITRSSCNDVGERGGAGMGLMAVPRLIGAAWDRSTSDDNGRTCSCGLPLHGAGGEEERMGGRTADGVTGAPLASGAAVLMEGVDEPAAAEPAAPFGSPRVLGGPRSLATLGGSTGSEALRPSRSMARSCCRIGAARLRSTCALTCAGRARKGAWRAGGKGAPLAL